MEEGRRLNKGKTLNDYLADGENLMKGLIDEISGIAYVTNCLLF